MKDKIKSIFKKNFSTDAELVFYSPGRMNIIGEHIDYNGGNVLPCALTLGTYAAIKPNQTNEIRVYSENFAADGIITFNVNELEKNESDSWVKYVKAMFYVIKANDYDVNQGFDCAIWGNIPNGAGLSSSASLEMLIGTIIKHINKLEIDTLELVKLAQKAENTYVGVNCGIMDQFSIGFGKTNKAIMLNCDTLDFEYTNFILEDQSIIICNTNKRRELIDSKYDERRAECDSSLEILKQHFNIEQLCELKSHQLDEIASYLNPIQFKRVRHAITENERVSEAFASLAENDITKLGELLYQSHESLKNDYEVTGIELDTLVECAESNGAIGARMTGAGFGGCIIAIVKNDQIDDFTANVETKYEEIIGYKPSFYIGLPGEGTTIL